MRILFVAGGSAATVFALAPLATAARGAGHEVVMAAVGDIVPVVAAVGLPGVSMTSSPIRDFIYRDRDGAPVTPPTDPEDQPAFTGRWFGRMAAATLGPLTDLAHDWRPDLVVGGTMMYAAGLLARRQGVPYVRHAWDAVEATLIDPGAEDELRPELERLGLSGLPAPDLFIDVCPPSLRPPDAAPAHPMACRPANTQRALEPWMYTRGGRPRVCVTAGSRVANDDGTAYLREAYVFLRDLALDVTALDAEVVIAAPESVAADLRAELPGVRAGWVPLDVVLRTCDLLVGHAGGVTTLTAMGAGVPQLLLPQWGILGPPTRRLAAYGAAVTLQPGEADRVRLAQSCRALLTESSYTERAKALAQEISEMPPPAELVGVLEKL
ncbi:glycosyltransferase [Streptomyces sp. DSM 15324]|uniref:glycosyltransferase n=1 Tax=Streptomyces sp. DSM 15324 TaxID=1739111 RepID=UPI000748EB96|nr:glycosyltransferase [Streptomyces sp. DSM 15324]KUO13114.1 C-glycosyltransferase SaqGT5 [Streptomyces sp. DSM 15324]